MKTYRRYRYKRIFGTAILLLFLGCILFFFLKQFYWSEEDKLKVENLKDNYRPYLVSRVYDDQGEGIIEFYKQRRELVKYDEIPEMMINALVSVEDKRFYAHYGIDTIGIARALVTDIYRQSREQGASTITQQLARSLFLNNEKTIYRKTKEIIYALAIERMIPKKRIIELYFNQVYFGRGAWGVKLASEVYFGKQLSELTTIECAFLIGWLKAPSRYAANGESEERTQYVLRRMREEGKINGKSDYGPLEIIPKEPLNTGAGYLSDIIKLDIERVYGREVLYRGGLKIYTGINSKMQEAAKVSILKKTEDIDSKTSYRYGSNVAQAAAYSIERGTSFVKVMVGGRNYAKYQYNNVYAVRQMGSSFKPFVYAAAFDSKRKFRPGSIIVDSRVKYKGGFFPRNYDGRYLGSISLRQALAESRNVPAVKLLGKIGTKYMVGYAKRYGFSTNLKENDLSIALGSASASLKELVVAYSVWANRGVIKKPILVKKIVDHKGNVLEHNQPERGTQVVSPKTSGMMTRMLRSVVTSGTARRLKNLRGEVVGKTGTTDGFKDAWFIGYSPKYVTGVWVGRSKFESLGDKQTGASAAIPIWKAIMTVE